MHACMHVHIWMDVCMYVHIYVYVVMIPYVCVKRESVVYWYSFSNPRTLRVLGTVQTHRDMFVDIDTPSSRDQQTPSWRS